MPILRPAVLLCSLCFSLPYCGQQSFAQEGKVLFADNFDRTESQETKDEPGNGWSTNSASRAGGNKQVDLIDGTMHIYFHESADHAVSVRHDAEFEDGIVRLRFMLPTKKDSLGLNFADLKYKPVHAGHICMTRISATQVQLQDLKTGNMDLKIREKRQAKQVSDELQAMLDTKVKKVKHDTEPGEWASLEVRIEGDTMTVKLNDEVVGNFSSEGIGHPTKRTLRLSVPKQVYIDDLEIVRLK